MRHLSLALSTVCALAASLASADITNITQGTTHATIQEAITLAVNGDEIVVDPGVYFESLNLLGKAITLRSQDPTDPPTVISTILNGGGSTVISCSDNEGPDTIIAGFVITGTTYSSAMANFGTSPTVEYCSFIGNVSHVGAGMQNYNGSPTVRYCAFVDNSVDGKGGGMRNNSASPTVLHCEFIGNSANVDGGGMFNGFGSTPTVTGCSFVSNTANPGGGIGSDPDSDPLITACIFFANTPDEIHGPYTDGGDNVFGAYPPADPAARHLPRGHQRRWRRRPIRPRHAPRRLRFQLPLRPASSHLPKPGIPAGSSPTLRYSETSIALRAATNQGR